MRRAIGDVEKERLILVSIDERRGGVGTAIDMVHFVCQHFQRSVLASERDVGGEGAVRILCEHVREPVLGNLRGRTQVPFTELGGDVTGLL